MSTCDTCKFWRKSKTLNEGWCEKDIVQEIKAENPAPNDGIGLYHTDDSFGFTTGPKFGCIHHQP